MKKLTVLLALCCITMANAQNWNKEKISGNGNEITVTRTLSEYDAISVAGPFKAELVSGKEGTITLNGDENLLEYIKTEVEGTKLRIYIDNDVTLKHGERNIIITIPFEKVNEITFIGSGDIKTKSPINSDHLEIKLAGSGNADLEVNSIYLNAVLAGSGDLNVSGTATDLVANLAGSGDLDCSKLEAQNANTSISGSGDLKVNCIKKLKAQVAGSGTIHYKGKPETIDNSIVGSGNVKSY